MLENQDGQPESNLCNQTMLMLPSADHFLTDTARNSYFKSSSETAQASKDNFAVCSKATSLPHMAL